MFCRLKPLKFKKVPDQIKSLVNLEKLPSCKVLTVGVKVQFSGWGLIAAGLKGNIRSHWPFSSIFLFSLQISSRGEAVPLIEMEPD